MMKVQRCKSAGVADATFVIYNAFMQEELRAAYAKLTGRQDLTVEETRRVFGEIMSGAVSAPAMGAFLGALAAKGECVDELVGAAQIMRDGAVRVRCDADCIDTCGTGGDGISTFNVSTAAAIVAASARPARARRTAPRTARARRGRRESRRAAR